MNAGRLIGKSHKSGVIILLYSGLEKTLEVVKKDCD